MELSRWKGIVMALAGASLWGLSGTVAQTLFQQEGFQTGWLVTVRMIVSGLLLLTMMGLSRKTTQHVWDVWKVGRDRVQVIIFGLLGMLGVQYTYFAAIEAGNAAMATLLQFLGPVFITLYVVMRARQLPSSREIIALLLALGGTFLLVTNGSTDDLSVPLPAVVWGLASALAAAFYTLYPGRLLSTYSSAVIVGWAMLIGGLGLAFVYPPWQMNGQHWNTLNACYVGFVIVFGTSFPFYLFLDSLRYIKPAEAGMLNSAEPLTAALASVLWLNVPFGLFEGIGGVFIIGTVLLLSRQKKREISRTEEIRVEC